MTPRGVLKGTALQFAKLTQEASYRSLQANATELTIILKASSSNPV